MNVCPNCWDGFEKGIGVYQGGHNRTFCSWRCVEQMAQQTQVREGAWPPPIRDKKFPEQDKK